MMALMMTLKKIRKIIIALFFLILAGSAGWWLRGYQLNESQPVSRSPKEIDFSLFWDVWQRLEKHYLESEKLDDLQMYYGAIKGMVASAGDPYTVFLAPKENKKAKEDLNGDFEGVGIQIGFKKERLAVIAPLSGTPAEKAGVKAGDLILRIEDEKKGVDQETMGISLPEAVEFIRGPKGTSVFLTLLSEGEEKPQRVEIVRATIVVPSVELEIKNGVAYLKLSRFGEKTEEEWKEAVRGINKACQPVTNDCRGLVLDLRNNPGGYLSGAVFIASEFLDSGVVVYQEGKDGQQVYQVNRQGGLTKIPMVVLINEGSASASEIVAGALKVRQRAVLIGKNSFGKGTIQEALELPAGAGLHVTTARWLLPNEERVNEEGLRPDYEVENDKEEPEKDLQLEKAIEILISNYK